MQSLTKTDMQDVYFGGTVLPPVPSDPTDANDPTFRFSHSEKCNLNLRGVPIVMEHSTRKRDQIGVGLNSYTLKSGETIMLGKLNGDSLKSIFARNAIKGRDPWYPSLSLCHAHRRYEDGTCEKIPKEVSLCKYPRREGSDIFIMDGQTKKKHYIKSIHNASKMTNSAQTQKVSAAENEKTAVDSPSKQVVNKDLVKSPPSEMEHTASNGAARNIPVDLQDQLSKMQELIIAQEKQLEMERERSAGEAKKALDMASELDIIHQAAAAKEKAALEASKKKAELIAVALVESLQNELPMDIDQATRESFQVIADLAPKHARAVYELCHEASIRHKKGVEDLKNSIKDTKAAAIQHQFDDVMSKRKVVSSTTAPATRKKVVREATHEAASADSWFRKAMSNHMGNSGNARRLMEAVQERNRHKFMPKPDTKRRRFY